MAYGGPHSHLRTLRGVLARPLAVGPDLVALALFAGAAGGMFALGAEAAAPFHEKVAIDLSPWALPGYALLSLGRGFAAYLLSLAFTLVYGTIAAHDRAAERVMLPALDVLQAIPVLGFLPGLVLALIGLFPSRELGLELACIVMIFTGQVWNMTFSFHASLRNVPASLREAAALQRLNGWQTFRLLEAPSATIGLVWNSMMSMAGGWFFLTTVEAFTLGARDFRLPGIGSYMSEAVAQGDHLAAAAAVATMIVMIVLVDQVVWRPLVVWSQRFKVEDSQEADPPRSWLLDLLHRSRLLRRLGRRQAKDHAAPLLVRLAPPTPAAGPNGSTVRSEVRAESRFEVRDAAPDATVHSAVHSAVRWDQVVGAARTIAALVVFAGAAWGAWKLLQLLVALPLVSESGSDWRTVSGALLASFLRTSAAVLLAAAWALPAGIAIGLSPVWSQRLQPLIQVAASFPAPMIFPLVVMFLTMIGVPFTIGCTLLMMLGSQWYILFNVIAGATAVPADLKETARVYRMNSAQRWRKLYLPCVFPHLVTGLVTAAGGAWNATIVSEYVSLQGTTHAAYGLGSTISQATADGNFPLLAASVTTMAAFVVFLNRTLWKRLYKLAEERYRLDA